MFFISAFLMMQVFLYQTLLMPKIIIDAGFQSRLLWKQDKSVVPDIGSGRGHFSPGNNFPPAADYVSGAFLSAVRDSSRRIKAGLPFKEARLCLHLLFFIRRNNLLRALPAGSRNCRAPPPGSRHTRSNCSLPGAGRKSPPSLPAARACCRPLPTHSRC